MARQTAGLQRASSLEYVNQAQIQASVQDNDILAAVRIRKVMRHRHGLRISNCRQNIVVLHAALNLCPD